MEIYEKLRKIRKSKGLTLAELSRITGFSISYLSQVERKNCDVTLTSLAKIAQALEVEVHSLFGNGVAENFLVKKDERVRVDIINKKMKYFKISGVFSERVMEGFIVICEPGLETVWESHRGEELFHVLEGAIKFRVDEKEYVLEEGDTIQYPSSLNHTIVNDGDKPAKLLAVVNQIIT